MRKDRIVIQTVDFEVKADNTKFPNGLIEGTASTFGNIDAQKEVVVPGAFTRSVKTFQAGKLSIPLFDNHQIFDGTAAAIGKVIELKETKSGLDFKAFFASTARAQEVRKLIQEGVLDRLSIGFKVIKDKLRPDGVRELLEILLREISVVVFPANELAQVRAVKGGVNGEMNAYERLVSISQDINAQYAAAPEVARKRAQAAALRQRGAMARKFGFRLRA